jgi:hypothetical protein
VGVEAEPAQPVASSAAKARLPSDLELFMKAAFTPRPVMRQANPNRLSPANAVAPARHPA